MVRSVKNHHHQEEEEDDEDSPQTDRRRNDQKVNSYRSKHSETEQRRRSKINERFQILRELIPENDQKRDRASFLLEVIQYIRFLQEKLQVYEGTYQNWNSEPTNLIPWRGNCGEDQSQPIKNGSVDEGNIVFAPSMLTNVHSLVEHNQTTYEPDAELAIALSSDGANQNGLEESSISDAYSIGLLNNLTQTLGSCGVDLSQASISVELDIRKGAHSGATSTCFGIKDDHNFLPPDNEATTHCGVTRGDDISVQAHKRPRTEENQKWPKHDMIN